MKLKELLKFYYDMPSEVTMSDRGIVSLVLKELILPGTYDSPSKYRKTLSWNLNRDVYYREVIKEDQLYATLTTGKMDFYLVFDKEDEFIDLMENGLKKHKSYRRETLGDPRKYLFYSRKYE